MFMLVLLQLQFYNKRNGIVEGSIPNFENVLQSDVACTCDAQWMDYTLAITLCTHRQCKGFHSMKIFCRWLVPFLPTLVLIYSLLTEYYAGVVC